MRRQLHLSISLVGDGIFAPTRGNSCGRGPGHFSLQWTQRHVRSTALRGKGLYNSQPYLDVDAGSTVSAEQVEARLQALEENC